MWAAMGANNSAVNQFILNGRTIHRRRVQSASWLARGYLGGALIGSLSARFMFQCCSNSRHGPAKRQTHPVSCTHLSEFERIHSGIAQPGQRPILSYYCVAIFGKAISGWAPSKLPSILRHVFHCFVVLLSGVDFRQPAAGLGHNCSIVHRFMLHTKAGVILEK